MTQRDRWANRPVVSAYWAYKEQILLCRNGYVLPDSFKVTFYLPMPKSWSKKRRREMDGKPHQSRPDFDNLLKGLCDVLMKEDSTVWRVEATKLWTATEGLIQIEELE